MANFWYLAALGGRLWNLRQPGKQKKATGENKMNTYQAKRIPLRDLLTALGCVPQRENKGELWYLSPFRQEGAPSFKVSVTGNAWYDFGLGKGGNIIDFAMQYFQVSSVAAALSELERCMGSSASIAPPPSAPALRPTIELKDDLKITKIQSLQNKALTDYLQSRGIAVEVARPYVQEMYYTRSKKHFFALAFSTQSGGWELRNRYFKGSAGSKDISIIQPASVIEDAAIMVFEGFMDFMSYLMWKKVTVPPLPVLVLNSTAMAEKAISTIRDRGIQTVHLCLDHDASGREVTAQFQQQLSGVNVVDQSALYAGHKDFNEFLQKQRQPELS